MDIGDRLRKMSNDEMAWFIRNELRGTHADILEKLNSEVETTAQEDFAKMGFSFQSFSKSAGFFYSKKEELAELRVWINPKTTHYMSIGGWFFTDEEIDQIRKYAYKARAEKGWV